MAAKTESSRMLLEKVPTYLQGRLPSLRNSKSVLRPKKPYPGSCMSLAFPCMLKQQPMRSALSIPRPLLFLLARCNL